MTNKNLPNNKNTKTGNYLNTSKNSENIGRYHEHKKLTRVPQCVDEKFLFKMKGEEYKSRTRVFI